jgi:hypothetical protein
MKWKIGAAALCIAACVASVQAAPGITTPAVPASLPVPTDLRIEAAQIRQRHEPLIVMFSLPGCPYCKVIRRNYLFPLIRDAAPGAKPLVREVDITSDRPLKDFSGAVVTQKAFAARYHARVSPTVILLDDAGHPLTEPLVGGDTAGFYGAYLDNAMAAAQKALDKANAANNETRVK